MMDNLFVAWLNGWFHLNCECLFEEMYHDDVVLLSLELLWQFLHDTPISRDFGRNVHLVGHDVESLRLLFWSERRGFVEKESVDDRFVCSR